MVTIKNIIFDLGGVLIDWNPTYLFSKVFDSQSEMDFFLSEICSPEWNEMQDGGRTLAEGTRVLVEQYPEHEEMIRLFYDRWEEMLGGALDENVELFRKLRENTEYRIYALTNWSAETWPIAIREYTFLQDFEGILVSGEEGLKKPDPKIYHLLTSRYNLAPNETLFIDDNLRNVKAAQKEGWNAIHYQSSEQLLQEVRKYLPMMVGK